MLLASSAAQGQETGTYYVPRYDIVSNGIGKEGTFTAEVSVYLKKPDKNVDLELLKAAVHGVLFRGIQAGENGKSQRPLAGSEAEKTHAEFFTQFFSNGTYARYATLVDGTLRVEKMSKKLYRVRSAVVVSKDALRELLESNGITESFKDLF